MNEKEIAAIKQKIDDIELLRKHTSDRDVKKRYTMELNSLRAKLRYWLKNDEVKIRRPITQKELEYKREKNRAAVKKYRDKKYKENIEEYRAYMREKQRECRRRKALEKEKLDAMKNQK